MKTLTTITIALLATMVFAGPHRGYCPGRYYYGPGWYYHGHGWRGDRGLANAAAITSIVADGVSIVTNVANTVRYQSQPVTPVYSVPVQTTPVVQPVYTVPVRPAPVYPAPVYSVPVRPAYVNPPTVAPVMPPAGSYRWR